LKTAKEALKRGSTEPAVALVGSQAIMPYFINNPMALKYSFGPSWDREIKKYTFSSKEEAKAALENEIIKIGDLININGVVGTAR
jgi:hypothetical protein